MTTVSQRRRSRARGPARPSGDEREQAILQTLERLLTEGRTLADISVDDLARGADLSRPTFYFYFPSKDAVLLALVEHVIHEADRNADAAMGGMDAAVDPPGVWKAINALFETFGAHRAVTLAGAAARPNNAEVRALWSRFMQKWIDYTTTSIQAERDRGAAPTTIPAHDLAISLNLMNERTMLAAFAGEQPAVDPAQLVNTLAHIWVTSIYGTTRH
ncbi:TetR/AcrR family transcriptional regulator [Mycolicibacterium phlei]